MIDFYNAFISYKHAKLDTAIAERVQSKLEHFHVPHSLKKKLKHQKITRIFRDKDELPITSDLTETITEALEKAEYLIVICSTNTKESIWVKREIATFLKTHTRDRILTVLCNGEPFEVIPEELLTMEKEVVDASGFAHTVKVPVEPLSCDYRFSKSKADKEELPRLASALLGCSYDELQRRRRQYRIRRAAAIVAAAFLAVAGLAGYSLYMTKKINDSYIEALRNRSIYLATESRELLEEDLRVDSVHIALAALPQDKKDKTPVTAAAVRALTDATAAYVSNSGNNFAPIWNYRSEYEIKDCKVTDDNKYIGVRDRTGSVFCWNTLTHELVFEKIPEKEVKGFLFLGNDTVMILCDDRVDVYNIQTGALMWAYTLDADFDRFYDGDVVYANNLVYINNRKGGVQVLSLMTGKEEACFEIFGEDDFLKSINCLAVSSDGTKLAFTDNSLAFFDGTVYIYDTVKSQLFSAPINTYIIYEIKFVDNDHLCVICDQGLSAFGNIEISEEATSVRQESNDIYMYDSSMKELWNASVVFTNSSIDSGTVYMPSRNALVYYVGNKADVFDIDTGALLNSYTTGSAIITANDYNQNGLPEFICKHGEYAFGTSADEDTLISYRSLCDKISYGIIGESIYAVPSDSKDLIAYNRFLQDDEWTAVKGTEDKAGSTLCGSYSDDDYLIIAASYDMAEKIRITIIDPNTGALKSSTDVDWESHGPEISVIKIDNNYYGCFGNDIYSIDPENGTVKKIYSNMEYTGTISNGKIITYSLTFDGFGLTVTELDGSDPVEFTYKDENADFLTIAKAIYIRSTNKVIAVSKYRVFAADLSTGEIEEAEIPNLMDFSRINYIYATASDDGKYIIITDGNLVFVIDDSLKLLYSFRCNNNYRFAAVIRDDILYLISDDRFLMYNSVTGEFIRECEITLYGKGYCEFLFNDKEHELFIKIGDQLSIFDTNEWVETAFVRNCYCYHAPTDRFFVYSFIYDTECTVGYIKHYSLEELIDKANRYLGTHELDEEIKAKYGLT